MSDKIDSLTLPNPTAGNPNATATYDIDLPPDNRISLYSPYYCTASGTAAIVASPYYCTRWDITNADIKDLYDGLVIKFKVPVLGNDMLGTGVKINNSAYKPVVCNINTKIGEEYGVDSTIELVYNSSVSSILYLNSATATTVTGCWQVAGNLPQVRRFI